MNVHPTHKKQTCTNTCSILGKGRPKIVADHSFVHSAIETEIIFNELTFLIKLFFIEIPWVFSNNINSSPSCSSLIKCKFIKHENRLSKSF